MCLDLERVFIVIIATSSQNVQSRVLCNISKNSQNIYLMCSV